MHLLASETIKVQHLFTFFILLLFGTASADYFIHKCLNTTIYTSGSPYQTNLNQLLSSLISNASYNGFYNDSAGDSLNTVYGRALCRGDLSRNDCSSCLTKARTQILQFCPNYKDAIIWFDECHLVHYSEKFVFNTSTVIFAGGLNGKNVSDPDSFSGGLGPFMSRLIGDAGSDSRFYAGDSINSTNATRIYGLAQCCRDLSRVECTDCLGNAWADATKYRLNERGVRMLCDSCNLRYEVYPFFQLVTPGSNSPATGVDWPENTGKRNKRGAHTIFIIIGSVGTGLVTVLLGFMAYYFWMRKKGANGPPTGATYCHLLQGKDGKSQDLPLIELATLQASTDNFSDSNKLGKGGFGPVYKGKLPDGKEIAVKRLSRCSRQGLEELMNEITLIAKLQHKNLVRLMGCCLEKDEKMLIYEYMPNKSLDFFLFDSIKGIELDWKRRFNIIAGIARGLLYLHEDSRLKVIHRDLKASNVLLDLDMNPKISDFGMARIFGVNQDEANTNKVVGTYGYMAPEYAMHGLFSIKSDVFSFGVLLLEIVSGKRNTGFYLSEHARSLLAYAWQLWIEGRGMELMDPLLGQSCPASDVLRYIQIGLLCVQDDPALRPAMSKVVLMLGTNSISLPKPMQPAFSINRTTIDSLCGCSANEVTLSIMDPR